LVLHRQAGTFAGVQLFLAVSQFVRQKHIDAGWPPERVVLKQNFSWPAPGREPPGDYFLYMGRLSPEKGLSRLLRVWRQVPAKLVVAGTGPLEDELRAVAPPQVEFRGFLPPQDLQPVLARARAVVLPSICYEAQPRSVLEAYANAVPVIAHRLGGLPEVVSDGETGLLVDPDDEDGWVHAAHRLLDDREVEPMKEAAYRRWRDDHSPERALQFLEAAYDRALASPGF
jgi:glycosyltransferase involved in cell wall biosynthesis